MDFVRTCVCSVTNGETTQWLLRVNRATVSESLADFLTGSRAGRMCRAQTSEWRNTGLSQMNIDTVDGQNPAPLLKPWETIVCWKIQVNHHSRVSKVVQDFVHPQYCQLPCACFVFF